MWKCVEKCQKVCKSAETILPFNCCPLVFLWTKSSICNVLSHKNHMAKPETLTTKNRTHRSAVLFKDTAHLSGVNKSARERIGRQNLSQKVPSKKGSISESYFLQGIIGKTHTQNLQILREDTLRATCSAGPFCLLPNLDPLLSAGFGA